jgi:hypothetical protein
MMQPSSDVVVGVAIGIPSILFAALGVYIA